MVESVIFDMDGLMFDTERIAVETWRKLSVELGYPKLDGLIYTCFGTNYEFKRTYFAEVLGKDFPYDYFVEREREVTGGYLKENGIPLKKGLVELLDFLDESGIKKAVATSTPAKSALVTIERSGLLHRFDAIVTGDAVEKSKPEPDIFLTACEKAGANPVNSIGLEDSYNGIRAIYAAGMKPIMIPDMVKPDEEISALCYKITDSLFDVIKIIKEL